MSPKLRPSLLDAAVERVSAAVRAFEGARDVDGRSLRWRYYDDETHLVAELVELRNSSADALSHVVREARQHGASWAALGRALGLSKQGAAQRYGRGVTRL